MESSAKECLLYTSEIAFRKQTYYLLSKIDFETAENEPYPGLSGAHALRNGCFFTRPRRKSVFERDEVASPPRVAKPHNRCCQRRM